MKKLSLAWFLVAASITTSIWAADASAPNRVVTGTVLEVQDVDGYSYLRLQTKDGETWAAVGRAPLKKGATVTIEDAMVMKDFESKSLKKTFPTIVFGSLAGGAQNTADPHAGVAKAPDSGPIQVTKATGADAHTVAEVVAAAAALKDRQVQVRGKIVKYNPGILGKNWIHLRDGSGSERDGSSDLVVTSSAPAKLGDVVTVTGMVRLDKDFGAGYVYKVLIEAASLR